MKIKAILFIVFCLFFSFSASADSEKCRRGGCSGEICENANSEPAMGICIWSEHFACYKTATCEEQKDGKCGWTQTAELKKCIEEKNKLSNNPVTQ